MKAELEIVLLNADVRTESPTSGQAGDLCPDFFCEDF